VVLEAGFSFLCVARSLLSAGRARLRWDVAAGAGLAALVVGGSGVLTVSLVDNFGCWPTVGLKLRTLWVLLFVRAEVVLVASEGELGFVRSDGRQQGLGIAALNGARWVSFHAEGVVLYRRLVGAGVVVYGLPIRSSGMRA
jgi:hypothetical protein